MKFAMLAIIAISFNASALLADSRKPNTGDVNGVYTGACMETRNVGGKPQTRILENVQVKVEANAPKFADVREVVLHDMTYKTRIYGRRYSDAQGERKYCKPDLTEATSWVRWNTIVNREKAEIVSTTTKINCFMPLARSKSAEKVNFFEGGLTVNESSGAYALKCELTK